MKIENNKVVGIEYTLKDKDGAVVDTNAGSGEPLYFIQGLGTIVPGLERSMNGKAVGESFDVTVKAADGYGEFDANRKRRIPKSALNGMEVQVGQMLQASGPEGASVVTVSDVTETEIEIDGNHPMAGKDLFFSIKVTEIRDATQEEISHGHAHGPGGHHHH
jgi:FKBP-type peptidyl-prolyl cis-trans isomerase SlyD